MNPMKLLITIYSYIKTVMCVFCPEHLEREVNKCNPNHAVRKDDNNYFEIKYFKIRLVKI